MKELKLILENVFVNFNGNYSIYANDFHGNIVEFNSNQKTNAASCIKVYILVSLLKKCYFENISLENELIYEKSNYVNGSGILRYLTPGLKLSIRDMAVLMMIISDNVATNIIIDFLGIDYINKTISELGLKNTKLYSKFESVEDKAFGETTTKDYGQIFELINSNKLWDKSISKEAINILKNQKYREMIGDGIPKIYSKTNNDLLKYIITKSGKYQSIRNDGGIVTTKYGNYVVVVFINNFLDKESLNDESIYSLGRQVSNILFERFIALKGSFIKK